jgi:acetyltransferase-like isoleucine patch superfamily enzyme
MRGKTSIQYDSGFTTGHACRFDLPGGRKKTLFLGKNCILGDNVHIVAHERIVIGDNCLMASKIFLSDTSHGEYNGNEQCAPTIPPNDRKLKSKPVTIGNNVWIGENVCILPGVAIEDGCVIGSNSVVNKSIPKNCIVAGVPAKIIKIYDENKGEWIKVI